MTSKLCLLVTTIFFYLCTLISYADENRALEEEQNWQDTVWHQWGESNPDWVEPIQPFRIIGNIYYVGTLGIGAYLIFSEQGHIVLDGGLPQNARQIADNIEALGFKLSDVKYLINSHAHFDHSGGLNELKQLTGAILVASNLDKEWLENGLYPGSEDPNYKSPSVKVDRVIEEGEELSLGSNTLTAHITPGHTPGCTSWQMKALEDQKSYRVVLFCGASVAGNRLVPDEQYPGIIEDYRATLSKIKGWDIDVYLSNHPFYFKMKDKREAQIAGDPLAFVDLSEFARAAKAMHADFELKLAKQKRQAAE